MKNIKIIEIDFLCITRNNEIYLNYFFEKILIDIRNNLPNSSFYFYENNSTDNTKVILNKLTKKYNNIYLKSENLIEETLDTENLKKFNGLINRERIYKIVRSRNNLLEFYKLTRKSNYSWVILFDTNIIFNFKKSILPLLKCINLNKGIMYASNTSAGTYVDKTWKLINKNRNNFENICLKNLISYYYDLLALDYGKYYLKNAQSIFNCGKELIKVDSCFGGLVIIKTEYFLKTLWKMDIPSSAKKYNAFKKGFICEHWKYCDDIKKHGEIYIVKNSKSLWVQDEDLLPYKKNKKSDYLEWFIRCYNF